MENILDSSGFINNSILDKKVMDPACGDGAFLKIIVSRIIDILLFKQYPDDGIKKYLENHVYGIEIDKIDFNNCISNLNKLVEEKINKKLDIKWKIFNDNTSIKI